MTAFSDRQAMIARKMTTMHLKFQNAETINRLVEQGELLLKNFHDEHQKKTEVVETEFARGELVGWRCTLHTLYRDCAEDIVTRVITRARLAIPDGDVPSGAAWPPLGYPWTEKGIKAARELVVL